MSLKDKQVILAGGAGGIGSAVTALLLEEGAKLIISYRANRERAERWSPAGTIVQADLSSQEDRARLLDAAPQCYGLVVLAGDPARGSDAFQRSHDANYLGPA